MTRYRRMPADEERALVERAHAGDTAARNRLVAANIGLVHMLARKREPFGDLDDLVQEGALGLMRAIETFDAGRGLRLCSYAAHWVRAYLQHYTDRQKGRLEGRPRRPALSLEGLMPDLDMPPPAALCSHDLPEKLEGNSDQRLVREAIARLPWDRIERLVVLHRVLVDVPETLRDVGARAGVSRERVRQVERKVMRRITAQLQLAREQPAGWVAVRRLMRRTGSPPNVQPPKQHDRDGGW